MSELVYDWQRFWYLKGNVPELSDSGFLPDPTSRWSAAQNPFLSGLDRFADLPCLVLLGEPGIGKSREIAAFQDGVRTAAHTRGDDVLFVDLRSVGSDFGLSEELFNAPVFRAWTEDKSDTPRHLHLFLDSLDECLLQVKTLAQILVTRLPRYPIERLSLRVACRTAVWNGSLNFMESGLRKIWGKDCQDKVSVVELAPLRRVDVLHAAERNGIPDPEDFVQTVRRAGAQAFAIKPVTLNLLLRVFKEEGKLPNSQAEIYRRGCRLLCEEGNESRQASGAQGTLSVDQRLAVAGRIAAATIFANRSAVFTQPDRGDTTEADVALTALAGGMEKDPLGGAFPVTDAALREVLDTGLFSGRGFARMGWGHLTYAEYLAAWYVTDLHRLSDDRIISLLVHPQDPNKRLAPQLHLVAAWVAPRSNGVLRHVAETDPLVLLASDTAFYLDVTTKMNVVQRLLEMVGKNALAVRDLPYGDQLRYLDYPDLPEQLRPLLIDKSADWGIRHAAIDISEGCERRELQGEWATIALDPTEPAHVRARAARTVVKLGDATARARMLPLAEGQAGDDPDDQLKGDGLRAVWPEHIDGARLVTLLTPQKRRNFYGAYEDFLRSFQADQMEDADLPDALRWVAEQHFSDLAYDARGYVAIEILHRAWERLDAPDVMDALADAALSRVNRHEPMFGTDDYDRATPPDTSDSEKRRRFVEALVSRAAAKPDTDDVIRHVCVQEDELFRSDDFPWLLERLLGVAPGSRIAQEYARLIHCRFRRCDEYPEQLHALCQAVPRSPELAQEYKWLFEQVEIGSERAHRMKEDYAEEQVWVEKRAARTNRPLLDPAPPERVLNHLVDFEAGDDRAWLSLCHDLQLKPDSRGYNHELEPDLMVLPGWEEADAEVRVRIIDAAERFLRRQPPGNLEWIDTNTLPLLPASGYRALLLLLTHRPGVLDDLPDSVWNEWASVVPAYPTTNTSEAWPRHRLLVALAYKFAPEATIQTIMRLIDKSSADDEYHREIDAIRDCIDDRLSETLLAKLDGSAIGSGVTGAILDVLATNGHGDVPAAARAWAERRLKSLVADAAIVEEAKDMAITLALHLMMHTPDARWDVIWPIAQANALLGPKIFEAAMQHYRNSGNLFAILDERQLAALYLWLVAQYPHDEDPKINQTHFVGNRETMGQWRDALLNHLAARGTVEATQEIEQLVVALPKLTWMPHILRQARDATRRNTWEPPTPEQVIRLALESDHYLVRSATELLSAVTASLQRLQQLLQGETPAAIDLWNEIPGRDDTSEAAAIADEPSAANSSSENGTRRRHVPKKYRPKSENGMSDYVKRYLEADLKGRGVILNREVEIRAGTDGGASGEITDIHVDAVVARADGLEDAPRDVVSVIIESKGAWNAGLDTAMEAQLVERYLRANRCTCGIYLVGWFQCSQWDGRDGRKRNHVGGTVTELRKRLEEQAVDVSRRSGMNVEAVVLDVSLR